MKCLNAKNKEELGLLINNTQFNYNAVNKSVEEIIQTVFLNKDAALRDYTKQFDKVDITDFKVTDQEVEEAMKRADSNLVEDLSKAYSNILEYHKLQLPKEYFIKKNFSKIGQLIRPIERVGMYVPNGTAIYPSTVLMNAAPAKIAGVKKIVMVTPPNKEGEVPDILLVAAKIAGINEIYKIGGAQAIAALSFGTESIPKVDKIVGPGNIYVAIAKKLVSGIVGIDMIAGPSEVVIIADETASATYIAADLLAQAEHDELAKVALITDSQNLIDEVQKEITIQKSTLSRKAIIDECLENNGFIVLVDNMEEAISVSNSIAPEHLELQFKGADTYLSQIINAGAIFVGEYSPEPVGDYFAGPNHTLPTSGTARFSSALSTTDFIKRISYLNYSKQSLDQNKDSIIRIAEQEGLTAHANSIKVRYKDV